MVCNNTQLVFICFHLFLIFKEGCRNIHELRKRGFRTSIIVPQVIVILKRYFISKSNWNPAEVGMATSHLMRSRGAWHGKEKVSKSLFRNLEHTKMIKINYYSLIKSIAEVSTSNDWRKTLDRYFKGAQDVIKNATGESISKRTERQTQKCTPTETAEWVVDCKSWQNGIIWTQQHAQNNRTGGGWREEPISENYKFHHGLFFWGINWYQASTAPGASNMAKAILLNGR